MKLRSLFLLLILLTASAGQAQELTPEQIASLKSRLESLKENLTSHLSTRNATAAQTFAAAANDPKAAVELYLNCVKMVEYDRKGRPESDFKAWKDGQEDRLRDSAFVTSLQLQLRYLALSCQAVESEDLSQIFGPLMSYVDTISNLPESPSGPITQAISGTVFAKAYYLERLFSENKSWEPIPINIGGIYTRTILPYLREKDPGSLMSAWDKRIEQQARLVETIESQSEKDMRGMNRDAQRRARNTQASQGGVLGDHARNEFATRVLPQLRWGKYKDMFHYVDQLNGAKAMLDFVEANLTSELGEQFYSEFEGLIESVQRGGVQAGRADSGQ